MPEINLFEEVHELSKRKIKDKNAKFTKDETRLIKKVYHSLTNKPWKGCSSCWQQLYLETSPETITNKINQMKNRSFHLLPGKVIMLHGIPTAYTESNLTDEAALLILQKSRAHIKFFASYPSDWEKQVANFVPGKAKPEVKEEVVLIGKAAKRKAAEEKLAAIEEVVTEEEKEEAAEEPIVDFTKMSKTELQGFASAKELAEGEWQNLSKKELVKYLEKKTAK